MNRPKNWSEIAESLTPSEDRQLREVLRVLRSPVKEDLHPRSDLLTEEFASEFRCRILLQHALQGSPLFQDTFEAAFGKAASASGLQVSFPHGRTERFWDLQLGKERLSLKSSKAKSLKTSKLHISKLSEAAWIQDCRTAKSRLEKTVDFFKNYLERVDRIIQLRYFIEKKLYELVEIPVSLLNPIFDAPVGAFAAEGSRIGIPVGASVYDLTVILDRSDAKITIGNIRKERCIVHGTWQLS